MYYILLPAPNGYTGMYLAETDEQLERTLTQLAPEPGTYAVVTSIASLPEGWQDYPSGVTFTVSPPTVGYDLSLAKEEAKRKVGVEFDARASTVVLDLPPLLLSSQAAAAPGDRLPSFASAFTAYNDLATELQLKFDAIDAATSISELNAIVNPPAISGQISLERNGLALEPSNFVTLIGCNPEDLVLYIPALVPVTLNYNPALPGYTSSGADVFDFVFPPSYICELRYATNLVGTFNIEDDVTPTVFNFEFTPTPTYPPLED